MEMLLPSTRSFVSSFCFSFTFEAPTFVTFQIDDGPKCLLGSFCSTCPSFRSALVVCLLGGKVRANVCVCVCARGH